MKNPKLTLSIVMIIVTILFNTLSDNAELFNISGKTLMIISIIITAVSMIWKSLKPDESLFTSVSKHIGTRPKKPRG